MRKYLILLSSIFTASSTSTMVVSCGAAPSGNEIKISWADTNWTEPNNDKTNIDNNLSSNIMLPTFNMINSTDQSRQQSTKPNDGMTQEQIDNSLWNLYDDGKGEFNTPEWKNFFKDWLSNKDNHYSKIDFSTGDTYSDSKAPTIKNYNLSKKSEDANSIYTSQTVASSVTFLNKYYANADVFNSNKNLVFVNLQNDKSKWGYGTSKDASANYSAQLQFTFNNGKTNYTFEAYLQHLVAELGLVKKDDGKYGWYLLGYSFVAQQDYPTDNFAPSWTEGQTPFKFILAPHKDNALSQYANPYLNYFVQKDSIK